MEHRNEEDLMLKIRESLRKRRVPRNEKHTERVYRLYVRNRELIEQTLRVYQGKQAFEDDIVSTIEWLEKVSQYVPITSENELEELIKVMVLLSQHRAKFDQLYDKPGLNLMRRVREGMTRYMIVLSELRARRKEYLEYWFTDEYWISEWSRIILDLSPENNMEKYGFANIKAWDFLFLLVLELAAADHVSKVDKPMVRLQSLENNEAFLIIPTEAAAEEYKTQIDRILSDNTVTFTQWVIDTLSELELPK
ncbi:MAG: hypothetical protein ACXADY_16385 [Candidatus Hodarchaeales archaeon]